MIVEKKNLKTGMRRKIFGCFFAIVMILLSLFGTLPGTGVDVYAEPEEGASESSGASCQDSLGSLGWLVCPTTGKISEAVDFLYDKIEDVLVINPVEAKDGSPVYEIWKYFQGVTNVVFMIFLLVIVFSQITGWGINNYGVKKALPKLIIAAILVNLSFYICSLAVDVSNIFGGSIRGLLESIEASAGVGAEVGEVSGASMAEMYTALASGATLAIGGAVVAFETGAIWMMIPMALGALVSVVIGLVTIAMRQAVVTLLIMVAPLAMVAYILPNTEQWFKKWKQLLFQMLIFYPAFSLLFGASSIAGWAIIVSSDNGFGVLIGTAVQIFPLFFSWNLMKMSGTVLGTINAKLSSLASKPLKGVRSAAEAQRELSKQKHLASKNAYTPSLKLMQFMSDRKIAMEAETKEHEETVKNRGLAYAAMRNYKRGTEIPSKEGEEAYEAQARNNRYKNVVERHKNNMSEKGLGQLKAVEQGATDAQKARLLALDTENVEAADTLKMEQSRGEWIAYQNAIGYHNRMKDALGAHFDGLQSRGELVDKNGKPVKDSEYKKYFDDLSSMSAKQAANRYEKLSSIVEGDTRAAQYAAASAAHSYETQSKVVATKAQKFFDLTPPTQNVEHYLNEWTRQGDAATNIDSIVAAMRVINMRGDTDIIKRQIDNMLNREIGGGIQLGTHASQSLASFLMFEVKDSDPFLRRFGKYINLETANVYNKNNRKDLDLTYTEYINGYHDEMDPATGEVTRMYAKKGMKELMEGTSFDNVERTTFASFDESLREAYSYYTKDEEGNDVRHVEIQKYLDKREEVQQAIGPQFISASLKYLSGSEQLTNAVSFLTGYTKKQKTIKVKDEDTGAEKKVVVTDAKGKPIYEWVDAWSSESDFADDPEAIRKYFNSKALEYVTAQTPSQILGMRSDYYTPMLNHLAMAYEETDMEGWTDEQIAEHEEYMKELADIQTRYGDLPPEEAKKKRDMDRRVLKNKMAGAQFRQLLDSKGKLNQIYKTRRSGAANNAKDWLREWLDLDNEVSITTKLENDRRKMREEYERNKRQQGNEGGDSNGIIVPTAEKIDEYIEGVEALWDELKGESKETVHDEAIKYIRSVLGKDAFIELLFEHYCKVDSSVEIDDMKEELEDLFRNPKNY